LQSSPGEHILTGMDTKVRAYLRGLAKKGAAARTKALTPAQRQALAKKAAAARWGRSPVKG
jgi:hypothetical protein